MHTTVNSMNNFIQKTIKYKAFFYLIDKWNEKNVENFKFEMRIRENPMTKNPNVCKNQLKTKNQQQLYSKNSSNKQISR